MQRSANETESRDVGLCAQAQHEPVSAKKAGHIVSTIPSAKQHQAIRASRKKVFEADFADWLAVQDLRVETTGVPGADLRPW